jgi:hypothetical protein
LYFEEIIWTLRTGQWVRFGFCVRHTVWHTKRRKHNKLTWQCWILHEKLIVAHLVKKLLLLLLLLLLFIPLSLRTEHRASTVSRHPRLLFQFFGSIRHLVGLLCGGISPAQGLYPHRTTQHRKTQTNIYAPSRIRTCDPNVGATEDSTCLRPLGHWDRLVKKLPAFYGTRGFFTVFARAHHWSLYWTRRIQSTPSHPENQNFLFLKVWENALWNKAQKNIEGTKPEKWNPCHCVGCTSVNVLKSFALNQCHQSYICEIKC